VFLTVLVSRIWLIVTSITELEDEMVELWDEIEGWSERTLRGETSSEGANSSFWAAACVSEYSSVAVVDASWSQSLSQDELGVHGNILW